MLCQLSVILRTREEEKCAKAKRNRHSSVGMHPKKIFLDLAESPPPSLNPGLASQKDQRRVRIRHMFTPRYPWGANPVDGVLLVHLQPP
jgi:hypothetical protein